MTYLEPMPGTIYSDIIQKNKTKQNKTLPCKGMALLAKSDELDWISWSYKETNFLA